MIISRTPFRVSFTGGGTDIKTFFKHEPGLVINAAINKYMYITVNEKFGDGLRISYSRTENLEHAGQVKHPLVKTCLKRVGIKGGIEITSMADIPSKGAGLGSSSSFTIGLLNALYAFKGQHRSAKQLAEEACLIERGILNEPGGKQDQYIAAYGGLRFMQFRKDGSVFVDPIICSPQTRKKLDNNLLMFYTGITRKSSAIIKRQVNFHKSKRDVLREMKQLTRDLRESIINNDISKVGPILHENWKLKMGLSSAISTNFINNQYDKAIQAGATGGKLMGAGGGGFLLFYCPVSKQKKVKKALSHLKEVPFSFEPQGSKIIYVTD